MKHDSACHGVHAFLPVWNYCFNTALLLFQYFQLVSYIKYKDDLFIYDPTSRGLM
jgi:hypothetical protein